MIASSRRTSSSFPREQNRQSTRYLCCDLQITVLPTDNPVILVTIADNKEMGFVSGASDYLTKPVDWNRLAGLIKKISPVSPHPVLAVEDEPGTGEMLQRSLQKDGWNTASAENGRGAREKVAEAKPSCERPGPPSASV